MLCSVCKKNPAIIFINKPNAEGKNSLEGFCYNCAKEKGINPMEVLSQQATILEGDNVNLDDMASQFESIFNDLTENLNNKDMNFDGASGSAIPIGAILGNVFSGNHNKETQNGHDNEVNGSNKKAKTEKD